MSNLITLSKHKTPVVTANNFEEGYTPPEILRNVPLLFRALLVHCPNFDLEHLSMRLYFRTNCGPVHKVANVNNVLVTEI